MSLRTFHKVFIALACALAFVFGAWCLGPSADRPEWAGAAAGAASFAGGAALAAYGVWFHRKLGRMR